MSDLAKIMDASWSDWTLEFDYGDSGSAEWDDYVDDMEEAQDVTIYDYQKIYSVCDFDTKEALGEASADCGGWKVAKTSHSDDPDKLCFGVIMNVFVSMIVGLVGF